MKPTARLALPVFLLTAGGLWPSPARAADDAPSPRQIRPLAGVIGAPPRVVAKPSDRFRITGDFRIEDFSADRSRYLVVHSEFNKPRGTGTIDALILHDADSGKVIRTVAGPSDKDEYQIQHAAFSPDGRRALTGGWHGWTRLWDVDNAAELGRWRENFRIIDALAFSRDGARFATATSTEQGSGKPIHLYDLASRQKLLTLEGHGDTITRMLFTAGGTRLVTSSLDGTVRVWELP